MFVMFRNYVIDSDQILYFASVNTGDQYKYVITVYLSTGAEIPIMLNMDKEQSQIELLKIMDRMNDIRKYREE